MQPPSIMLLVRTNEPKAAATAGIGASRALRERSALMGLLQSCFARTQTWLQAGKYLNALVSDLSSRNGWSVAEYAGDRSPGKAQRLLNRASWDERAAMSLVRRYAAAGLDDAARRSRRRRMTVGALDETGQEKQGSSTAGVKRRYMGCAGRVANGINTVHGHALAGARQWIPAEDIRDPVKSLVTGLPLDLRFRTKGQLAVDILGETYADGLAFDFVCGDEVYGSCTDLRKFLEDRGQAYVLRVASNFTVTLAAASPRHSLLVRRHLKTGELPGSPGALLHRGPLGTAHARSHARGPGKPLGRFMCMAEQYGACLWSRRAAAVAGRWRARGMSGCARRRLAGCGGRGNPP